nr:hypothetical protein [Tanacetum cinerariifolium]
MGKTGNLKTKTDRRQALRHQFGLKFQDPSLGIVVCAGVSGDRSWEVMGMVEKVGEIVGEGLEVWRENRVMYSMFKTWGKMVLFGKFYTVGPWG